MAVGVACGATGMPAALDLLQPLLADPVDFVRQGALIATALVLLQQPEARVQPFRKQLAKFMGDKHEEVMCRCAPTLKIFLGQIPRIGHVLLC